MLLDFLAVVVDYNHADIGEFRSGGLDRENFSVFSGFFRVRLKRIIRRAVRPAGHNSMRMAVKDYINPRGVVIQIHAPMSVRGGFIVHAEMRQGNDNIRAVFAQSFNLALRAGIERFFVGSGIGHELNPLNQTRIDFRLRFRRFHAQKADCQAGI